MKEVISIFQVIALLLEMVTALGYQQSEVIVRGHRQEIYLLEVNIEKGAKVSGAMAKNSVFGFETIDSIASRQVAIASVNGMFFDDLGSPAGYLCENGKWVRINGIGTPSLVIADRPFIEEIVVKGEWKTATESGRIDALNIGAYHGICNLFTREYGDTNRVFRPQVSYRIKGGKVTERLLTVDPVDIDGEYVMTYLLREDTDISQTDWQHLPSGIPVLEIGDKIEFCYEVQTEKGERIFPQNVYQTGGWILKDGKIVAKDYEPFLGYTTSLQPRTVVGINQAGNLVFCVVDGRRKHRAEGLTGLWLAELLQQMEWIDAAYLDGGASSMMWMGELLNTPAFADKKYGKEIAHALLFHRTDYRKYRKKKI